MLGDALLRLFPRVDRTSEIWRFSRHRAHRIAGNPLAFQGLRYHTSRRPSL